MRYQRFKLVTMLAVLVGCSSTTGPPDDEPRSRSEEYEWSGDLTVGTTLEIKNVKGDVRVTPSSDGRAHVRARLTGTRDDPSSVHMEVVESTGGITLCSVYPDVPGLRPNECHPGWAGQLASGNNDVSVTIRVALPAGCDFVGRTVSGSVEALDLTGDVSVGTIRGDLRVTTSGLAEATTVAGDITASIGAELTRDIRFGAVRGNVTVRVPAKANADVWGSTLNGSITSDFALSITPAGAGHVLRGVLGRGGPAIHLTTTAGDIALRSH
jgi:hypothetical protein